MVHPPLLGNATAHRRGGAVHRLLGDAAVHRRGSGASWSGCPAAAPDSGEARVFVFGSESEGICGPRGAKLRSNSYVFLRG